MHVAGWERNLYRLTGLLVIFYTSFFTFAQTKRPVAQDHNALSLLFPGYFHAEEIPENYSTMTWFGLFESDGKCYTEKTKVIFERYHDEIADSKFDTTGWKVSLNNEHHCIMLLNGLKGLSSSEITSHALPDAIAPGERIEFTFGKQHYVLYANGNGIHEQDNWDSIGNYRLQFSYSGEHTNGVGNITELVFKDVFEGGIVSIIWCGDIDGDLKPDFLINTTHHYNVAAMTLFLSSKAENGKLVKEVVKFIKTGC